MLSHSRTSDISLSLPFYYLPGDKPVPPGKPGKPAPKPKPKAGAQSSGGLGHSSDDYANLPLSQHGQQRSIGDDKVSLS